MKKLLLLLFSIFLFSSPSVYADDISDFKIEGMSIGDSLLDYMTEDEILEGIEFTNDWYLYLNEPNKYAEVPINKNFPIYKDGVTVFVKNNLSNKYLTDSKEKYTIHSIRAFIHFVEDPDSCIEKRNEIAGIFSGMFPNALKDERSAVHKHDPSGNSTADTIYLEVELDGILLKLQCVNWEENFRIKKNYSEGLTVGIRTKEIREWLTAH